jgi:hypothetical protein
MEKIGNEIVSRDGVGLIGQWVALGTGVASHAMGTGFGVLQDVRTEFALRVDATIDWVDASQQGTLRLLRSIHHRIDELSREALQTSEHALSGLVRGVRTTSDEATKFASRAASVLVDAPAVN